MYILAWKDTESLKAGAPELLQPRDGAARGEAPRELNQSHSTSLCWLLGKAERIPGVFQPPWLLLCQVQAGRIPRVQLSTSSSPVGDNNHITLLGFPSVLNTNPISTITSPSCVCSVRRDKGTRYFDVLCDFVDERDISDCCNLTRKERYWHLKITDGCFTNVWIPKNSCRRQCC